MYTQSTGFCIHGQALHVGENYAYSSFIAREISKIIIPKCSFDIIMMSI